MHADRPNVFGSILGRSMTIGLALSVVALFVLAEPHDALLKADLIGFAACHRISERSLHIDGFQLPVCARRTGIYVGLLAGWTWIAARRRSHAAQLPPRAITRALIGFIVVMGVDGLNSTANLAGLPHLYETENWMRLVSGALYGIAVSALLTPYVTVTLWREPTGDSVLRSWGELIGLVGVAAGVVMLALTEAAILLWPLVMISMVGAVGLMALMNTSITTILLGRVNVYAGWRDLLMSGLIGVALALIEFAVLGALRANLT